MRHYYLDDNIYSLEDKRIQLAAENLKKNNIRFLYSLEHIEEIFKTWEDGGL